LGRVEGFRLQVQVAGCKSQVASRTRLEPERGFHIITAVAVNELLFALAAPIAIGAVAEKLHRSPSVDSAELPGDQCSFFRHESRIKLLLTATGLSPHKIAILKESCTSQPAVLVIFDMELGSTSYMALCQTSGLHS